MGLAKWVLSSQLNSFHIEELGIELLTTCLRGPRPLPLCGESNMLGKKQPADTMNTENIPGVGDMPAGDLVPVPEE
ncbi:hypothetical protein A2U01_0008085 [Trifolium medium]|uniref:Uncharacterized protein n=1 Tax=Trifolium medium TaxID=97028 RepID=A0A392MJI5_9FABA|nr:hypothetical protein [Trifolium medium]